MKRRLIIAATSFLVLAGGGFVWAWRHSQPLPSQEPHTAKLAVVDESEKTSVRLSEAKRDAAQLMIEPAAFHEIQQSVIVAGRVEYDDTRHVEVRAATDSVVSKVLVKPGDRVAAGQVLSLLSSPEVGSTRANVRQRQAERQLAERAAAWEAETWENLQQLVKAIEARQPLKQIRADFDKAKLGEHRAALLSAYARWELAQSAAANLDRLTAVLPERTIQERLNAVEMADAAVKAVCEQSTFDARQKCDATLASVKDARRRQEIAEQQLTALLGYAEKLKLAETEITAETTADANDSPDKRAELSLVECRAPFAGTIERKVLSTSERAKPGDTLFVLADTSRLWIAADIREREWSMINLGPETELVVESPALPGEKFIAKVHYVGREVSPDSHAIPLVATIDNANGQLRPGLFVRVTIPAGESTSRLAVPVSAVVEHEQHRFVFVQDDPSTFRRVDVVTGLEADDLIEIKQGLTPGLSVVTRGAFVLKSELLLEAE